MACSPTPNLEHSDARTDERRQPPPGDRPTAREPAAAAECLQSCASKGGGCRSAAGSVTDGSGMTALQLLIAHEVLLTSSR